MRGTIEKGPRHLSDGLHGGSAVHVAAARLQFYPHALGKDLLGHAENDGEEMKDTPELI